MLAGRGIGGVGARGGGGGGVGGGGGGGGGGCGEVRVNNLFKLWTVYSLVNFPI